MKSRSHYSCPVFRDSAKQDSSFKKSCFSGTETNCKCWLHSTLSAAITCYIQASVFWPFFAAVHVFAQGQTRISWTWTPFKGAGQMLLFALPNITWHLRSRRGKWKQKNRQIKIKRDYNPWNQHAALSPLISLHAFYAFKSKRRTINVPLILTHSFIRFSSTSLHQPYLSISNLSLLSSISPIT